MQTKTAKMKGWTWIRPDGSLVLSTITTTKADAELLCPRDAETRGYRLARIEIKELNESE